jgi:hypothetical protein
MTVAYGIIVSVLHAYIDETGDRGLLSKPGSSPVFGMAAILLTDDSAAAVRRAIERLDASSTCRTIG